MPFHLAHRRAAKALAAAATAAVVKRTATTHRPKAGAPWPIALEAHDRNGRPLRAEVRAVVTTPLGVRRVDYSVRVRK